MYNLQPVSSRLFRQSHHVLQKKRSTKLRITLMVISDNKYPSQLRSSSLLREYHAEVKFPQRSTTRTLVDYTTTDFCSSTRIHLHTEETPKTEKIFCVTGKPERIHNQVNGITRKSESPQNTIPNNRSFTAKPHHNFSHTSVKERTI